MSKKTIFYIMGVSGCGKTTVGKKLSEVLGMPFFDGDDFHPDANVRKMASGIPLTDTDRWPWLEALNILAKDHLASGAVIACSALKERYRELLTKDIAHSSCFVFLDGKAETILGRLKERKGHFMPESLLASQFDALERPAHAVVVSIDLPPELIVARILDEIP